MTDREAMQQALEALQTSVPTHDGFLSHCKAMNHLRIRLAQPEQEPVSKYCCHACFDKSGQVFLERMILCPECGNKRCPKATSHELQCTNSNEPNQAELRLRLAQPEPKPVAIVAVDAIGQIQVGWITKPQNNDKLYITPPQRPWVDLTPKEIEACRQQGYANGGLNAPFDFDKAAGALLALSKEKNT